MAEAVFRHAVTDAGLEKHFVIDSAGTGSWHVGSPPHPETQAQLRRNTIAVGDQHARQVQVEDFAEFHYIVAMDTDNANDLRAVERRAVAAGVDVVGEVSLLLEYAPSLGVRDVPDPYYAGGYDRVFALVFTASVELLEAICNREGIAAAS